MAKANDEGPAQPKYEVGTPAVHGMRSFAPETTPAPAAAAGVQPAAQKPPEQAGEPAEKRAIWIVHGMGQQIKLETLDSLTEGLLSVAGKHSPENTKTEPKATAQSVKIGDQTLQRVVLRLKGKGGKPYELHLYEAYWAPLTEGVAKLRDVISFLLVGGFRGLFNSAKQFRLEMFDRTCKFRIPLLSPLYIVITLVVLAALGVLNAVILAATGSQLSLFGNAISINARHWQLLTAFASSVSAIALSFGVLLFLAGLSRPPTSTLAQRREDKLSTHARRWICTIVSWAGTILTAIAIVVCAVFYGLVIWKPALFKNYHGDSTAVLQATSTGLILVVALLAILAVALRAWKRSNRSKNRRFLILMFLAFLTYLACLLLPAAMFRSPDWTTGVFSFLVPPESPWLGPKLASPWWVWPFLGIVSWQVRNLMVEYVGDVAVYISPQKLDRFNQVREKIKDVAYKSASAVYLAKEDGSDSPLYSHVAVVGHSLGSVIAYDTLNRLIREDEFGGNRMQIVDRTCLFETFGSPLDKITFFFTIQAGDSLHIRSRLTEVVRPMIHDYRFRKFPWKNIRSRNDIVAGPLRFYDLPKKCKSAATPSSNPSRSKENRAEEVIDKDASVALAAHVEYWKNPTVWLELLKEVAP